jgi:hypothetical protein
MATTFGKLSKTYIELVLNEYAHHTRFLYAYYAIKTIVYVLGVVAILESSGWVVPVFACIAIASTTSIACFLFSLRTLGESEESEKKYRPILRFNAELCSAADLLLAAVTVVSAAITLDHRTHSKLHSEPTRWFPVVSRVDDLQRSAGKPLQQLSANSPGVRVPVPTQTASNQKDLLTLILGLFSLLLGGSAAGHKVGLALHELRGRVQGRSTLPDSEEKNDER